MVNFEGENFINCSWILIMQIVRERYEIWYPLLVEWSISRKICRLISYFSYYNFHCISWWIWICYIYYLTQMISIFWYRYLSSHDTKWQRIKILKVSRFFDIKKKNSRNFSCKTVGFRVRRNSLLTVFISQRFRKRDIDVFIYLKLKPPLRTEGKLGFNQFQANFLLILCRFQHKA